MKCGTVIQRQGETDERFRARRKAIAEGNRMAETEVLKMQRNKHHAKS